MFVSTVDGSAFHCGQIFWLLLLLKSVLTAVKIPELLVNTK
jgi:hypothetical protein